MPMCTPCWGTFQNTHAPQAGVGAQEGPGDSEPPLSPPRFCAFAHSAGQSPGESRAHRPPPPAVRGPHRTPARARPRSRSHARGGRPHGGLSGMPPFSLQPSFALTGSRACLNGQPCPCGAQSCLCQREAAAGRGVSRRDWPHSSPAHGRRPCQGTRAPKRVSPGKWGA